MKKRLLAITAIVTAVVGAIVLTFALLPPRPGVTKVNFDRLKKGMSPAEVQSVFGEHNIDISGHRKLRYAKGEDGHAEVQFNENEQIVEATWVDYQISTYQKLQRRFPWLPD